jgi:hypothetical protein
VSKPVAVGAYANQRWNLVANGKAYGRDAKTSNRTWETVAGEGNEARDGASDSSPQDRGHCFDTLEEGGTFRRGTTDSKYPDYAENSSMSVIA